MFVERIAHVDMDAFFVEVERLRRPELVGKAVLVGGDGPRGVVAAASYEARRRGARSAMPMAHARRLCPHAMVVPPDHVEYRRKSAEVFEVFQAFTPLVEALSVDEAFLDISGLRLHHERPVDVAHAIQAALFEQTGLPASVGVATSKFVAKLASEAAKPNGVVVVAGGTETDFLHPLGVRALWGVGEATYARLEELGISTIGELASFPRSTLERRLGPALGSHLASLAIADDPRPVSPGGEAKSISVEQTFDVDLVDFDRVEVELLRQSDLLASRLRGSGVAARTIHLKVRWSDFTTVTRSQTLQTAADTAHAIYATTLGLLDRAMPTMRPIRLLGIAGDGLVDASAPRQLGLTDGARWDDVAAAVDRVRERFGGTSVRPARLSTPQRRDPDQGPPPLDR